MKNRSISLISLIFVFTFLLGNVAVLAITTPSVVQAVTKTSTQAATTETTATEAATPATSKEPTSEASKETTKEDTGVIGLFGLNWKLFLAQLVNFAIVLFVLWRFVFKPVVAGMEARTKKIEDSLNTADKVNKEKAEFEEWKAKEMVNARHQATEIISEAKKTATTTKDQILEQAKVEQQQILDQSKQELEKQKQQTLKEAQSAIADLVVQSTEKLLRAKLDSKADAKLIQTVLNETDREAFNG